MASCSLLSRLLNHGPLRRFYVTPRSVPETSPTSNLNSHPQSNATAVIDDSINNLLLLNIMAGQGSPMLKVLNVVLDPITSFAEIDQVFYNYEGYLGLTSNRQSTQDDGKILYDFVYTFRTAADASDALSDHATLSIGGNTYPLASDGDGASEDSQPNLIQFVPTNFIPRPRREAPLSPPRKRIKREKPIVEKKITCKICFSELEGVYSTPCRRCKVPTCYDCLSNHFRSATKDIERMPVTCCGSVIHHDVAKGILPAIELEEYKQKYDERMNTTDPLYCPIPTCSAFIPARTFKNITNSRVACHTCDTVICTKCKEQAIDDHTCAKDDPRKIILETFHYKLCPKCGTGVMKMFGCPHVRCSCNAHWCWDCQRPMNACYQKPCVASRGEGNYSDVAEDDIDSDDENPMTAPAVVVGTAAPMMTTPAIAREILLEASRRLAMESTGPVPPLSEQAADDTLARIEGMLAGHSHPNPMISGSSGSDPRYRDRYLNELNTILNPEATSASDPLQTTTGMEYPYGHESTAVPQAVTGAAVAEEAAAERPAADQPAGEQPAVEEPTTQPSNLDDPHQFEWEAMDLNFGEEPTDESWDTWGCRHRFVNLEKDRIPLFWLLGINPATDASMAVECMGCFEKTTVWDDVAELEAFRAGLIQMEGVEPDKEVMEREWAEWKAQGKDVPPDDIPGTFKILFKSTVCKTYECRHGCGVVYCKSCRKESKSRMRTERAVSEVQG